MTVQKTDDPAFIAAQAICEDEQVAEHIKTAYAAHEQAVRDFVECIKEDGSDMAFARDTQKAYERLRELYGL